MSTALSDYEQADPESADGTVFEPPRLPLREDVVVTAARSAACCGAAGCRRGEFLQRVYIGRSDTARTLCIAHTVDFLYREGAILGEQP